MSSDEQRAEQRATPAAGQDESRTDVPVTDDVTATEDATAPGTTDTVGSPDSVNGDAAEATADADGAGAKGADRGRKLFIGAAALAVAAVLVAGWFGVSWWIAGSGDDAAFASTREDVVRDGTTAVKAFTELDFNNPDQFFDNAINSSIGDPQQQMQDTRETGKKTMVDAKSQATTKVLDLAVDELDDRAGKARFLAAIQVTVKQGEQSSVKPLRLEVEMTRVDDSWKLSQIGPVPVIGGGQPAPAPPPPGQ
ncbi:hypothetical protein CFN78_01150 [Amycolatopsis antarctica]|uniref:Mce-associated membrane protein n=1 Tax=Amycolatopsis antarctica TaxID=1854586 RepID=A0A263D8S2_9PSEU|nr:hypothetical protein [Amycolatopsis antarctica]OZM74853.1 hypothetical protein CFN78_01150 [Amycolatopsis antarctica]